jgi:ABC-type multidrug transport system fused ATPase/permease subunit
MTPSYTAQDLTQQQKAEKFGKLGKKTDKNDGKIIRDDDDEDIKVGFETYKQLVGLFGGVKYLILACLVSAFLCYCRIKTDYVIAQQTKYGQFIFLVSAFALSSLVSEAIKSILLMILNMRAATDMHDGMIQRIVRAPQNLFFDTHSNASVMKRLSEDLGTLENHMADAFVDAVQSL